MKQQSSAIYLFALGHLSVDWAQGAIPALLPYFIAHYGLNYQSAGALIFANVLLASILQPLFGYYSDKISRPWFVPLGPVLCGLAVTAMGFLTNYYAIFAAAILCGVGSALFHPEAALMVNRISVEKKGKAMGTFSVGGNGGFAIGPILAGICAYHLGIHSLVIFGIVNLFAAALLYSRSRKVFADTRVADRKKVSSGETGETNDWPSFGKLSVCILARSMGFTLSNTFIPLLWIGALGATASQGTTALSILFGIGAVCTYFGGMLSDRLGYRTIIRTAFCIMVPAYFLLTNTTNLFLATALLVPCAISVFSGYSPMVILGQTYLGRNAGFASGVTLGLSTTLGGIFAPIVGWAADIWGLTAALQILWIAGILGAIAAFTLKNPAMEKAK